MTWYYEGVEGSKMGQFGATMMGGGILGDAAAPRHIWKHYGVDGEPDMMAWAYVRDYPDGWAPPDEPPRSSKVKTKKIRTSSSSSSDGRAREGSRGGGVVDVAKSGPAGGFFLGRGILSYGIMIVIGVVVLAVIFFQNPLDNLKQLDEANSRADAAHKAQVQSASSAASEPSGAAAVQSSGSSTAGAATPSEDSSSSTVSISGPVYDLLDGSVNGSYAYAGGDDASDASHGGHFSKFDVSGFDKDAGTFRIDFEWYDAGASEPSMSGDMTARYVNDGDLGDFSMFQANGETKGNIKVRTTARFRVYPGGSQMTVASMEVVASDSSGAEVYRMTVTSCDLEKQ